MKKISILFLVAMTAFSVNAQETVSFKIGYKPNTTYTQTTTISQTNSVSYGTDMEPMASESSSKMISVTSTGKLENGIIPLTIKLTAEKGSDTADIMPEGATIKGHVNKDGIPEFENIEAPGMQQQAKDVMLMTMKTMLAQSIVEERKVKVGESFTIDTPLSIPMGAMTMEMTTSTIYKLTKVVGRKAFFDLTQAITIATKIEGQDMKGKGTGKGTLVYDMDNNYSLEQNIETKTAMDFEAQGMVMNIAASNVSAISTVITPNK